MDFSTLCRTCLGTTALRPLFASNADHKRHATTVFITTGIKVELNDGLPQQMCTTCFDFINSSLTFRRQCKNSEDKLLQLNQSNKETLPNSNKIGDCDTEGLNSILKTELKYEFEVPDEIETVNWEDSVGENDAPLGCFKNKDNCDVLDLQLNQSNKETLANSKKIDDCDTEDFKCNILKTELKYEFDVPEEMESVKCEDSLGENDAPLGCFKSKDNEEKNCDVLNVKAIGNTKGDKKRKVQRVSCTICGKDLSVRSVRAHVTARHPAAAGLRCGVHGSKFTMTVTLYTIYSLRLQYCALEHGSKEALATHTALCPLKKKRRVSDSGKELVSCDVCHKPMQRNSLRAHQAVKHKGLGPVCEHCGRGFGNKLRLSEHLRAKHGYDKLQCSHCEFKSSSRAALENHERRHRGEKPFICETCGAKFHAAYLLAQHRHSHRTEKRIKCGLCGAAFKATNSLHAHRAARHGARRHRCPLCARAYSCRHYAVKHLRTVHGFKGTVPPLQVDPAPT
ncbi:zinc finger protein 724-like [Cydia amplana]|uniref:zinc finger protein 724-like n=1 Tax=Cydia amplana TaxID=1869771 RepID=UPI002FE54F9A